MTTQHARTESAKRLRAAEHYRLPAPTQSLKSVALCKAGAAEEGLSVLATHSTLWRSCSLQALGVTTLADDGIHALACIARVELPGTSVPVTLMTQTATGS